MYRLALVQIDHSRGGQEIVIPYNDGAVEDYCFYSVISESGAASELRAQAKALGFTPAAPAIRNKSERRSDLSVNAYIKLCELTHRWGRPICQALAWVKIPAVQGLPIRAEIGPMGEAEFEEVFCNFGCPYELGVEIGGEDLSGNAAVIITGWAFYHNAPLNGYTWQSVLELHGTSEVFGFADDSDTCPECGVIDSRDDGYMYNFRETPSGGYAGVNCGCYDELCEKEWEENINDSEKCINLELARKLALEGKLEFVARYIGGMVDPGRGGFFVDHSVEEDAPDAAGFGSVNNGQPGEVMSALVESNADGEWIMAIDEVGQFQTYFSVWRVVRASEVEAA